jgi:hypothetical protein
MGNQRVEMRGVLPWRVRWTRRAGTKGVCLALSTVVSQLQNIIFLTAHFFTVLGLIAQQAWQATMLGRLSLSVCLWSTLCRSQLYPPVRDY